MPGPLGRPSSWQVAFRRCRNWEAVAEMYEVLQLHTRAFFCS